MATVKYKNYLRQLSQPARTRNDQNNEEGDLWVRVQDRVRLSGIGVGARRRNRAPRT